MKVIVNEHKCEIKQTPVNELEVNVTKVEFEFNENIPSEYVKKAFFSNDVASIEVLLTTNECDIPNEVLTKIGQVRLGVIAYEVQDDTLIERFNPSPCYFNVFEGSMIQADNTEPITPTDKEQIEQMLSNIQLGVTKEGKIVTITFTNKDGSTQTEALEDGKSIEYNWDGTSLGIRQEGESTYQYVNLKGDKGDAGAIKMIIVAELPETGADDTIYLVPLETPDVQGNNYAEYVYINGAWELLGKIGVQVDLTDYVKNTDYASDSTGGVIKTNNTYATAMENGSLRARTKDYNEYQILNTYAFISKGTLENVITGKGLVSNTDYATTNNAGLIKASNYYGTAVDGNNGNLKAVEKTYENYTSAASEMFISKGTLDNVLTAKIGDINSVLDAINGEVI